MNTSNNQPTDWQVFQETCLQPENWQDEGDQPAPETLDGAIQADMAWGMSLEQTASALSDKES